MANFPAERIESFFHCLSKEAVDYPSQAVFWTRLYTVYKTRVYNRPTEKNKELVKIIFYLRAGDRRGNSSWKGTHFPDTLLIKPTVARNCRCHKFLSGTTSANTASKALHYMIQLWNSEIQLNILLRTFLKWLEVTLTSLKPSQVT